MVGLIVCWWGVGRTCALAGATGEQEEHRGDYGNLFSKGARAFHSFMVSHAVFPLVRKGWHPPDLLPNSANRYLIMIAEKPLAE